MGLIYDQILDGVEYMAMNTKELLRSLTIRSTSNIPWDASTTYFDCTNFYFEIDKKMSSGGRGLQKKQA